MAAWDWLPSWDEVPESPLAERRRALAPAPGARPPTADEQRAGTARSALASARQQADVGNIQGAAQALNMATGYANAITDARIRTGVMGEVSTTANYVSRKRTEQDVARGKAALAARTEQHQAGVRAENVRQGLLPSGERPAGWRPPGEGGIWDWLPSPQGAKDTANTLVKVLVLGIVVYGIAQVAQAYRASRR